MARRLTIALLGLTMSAGLLAVASVNISPAIPDVVICNNRGVDGSVDAAGYTFTDAFDFQTYASPTGVAKADIQWNAKLEAGSAEKLQINGQNIGTTMTNNLTRVGEANFNSMATFVGLAPTADTLETVTFQAWTGIDDTDDYATQTISVKYVDDGSKDELIGGLKLTQTAVEDWADTTGWNALNIYNTVNLGTGAFGNGVAIPSPSANKLTVSLAAGQYMSFINDTANTVEAGKTYLVKVPVTVNFTKSGTGMASYPVLRFVCTYEANGVKAPDNLMYSGYAAASGTATDIYCVFTAETATESFKVRLDVLNTTTSAGTIVFDQVSVSQIDGLPTAGAGGEDWADNTGWNALNIYNTVNLGTGAFGNGVALPAPAANKLTVSLAAGAYMSFINDTAVSATTGTYLVKVPVKVNFTKSGSGMAAYPVVRFVNTYEANGTKAPDLLMYSGYAAASNATVDYYNVYTAEAASESFKYRLDVLNTTSTAGTVEFGQIEVVKIY